MPGTVITKEEQFLKPTLGLMLLHSASKLLQFLWTFTAQSETHTHKKVLNYSCHSHLGKRKSDT